MGPGPDQLATPGIAVRHASVARHVTDCATWPGMNVVVNIAKAEEILRYIFISITSHINYSVTRWPDTRCLSQACVCIRSL